MVIVEYILILTATIVIYAISYRAVRNIKLPILHPLLVSMAIIIFALNKLDIEYEKFDTAMTPIRALLAPSVVSLGWLLYKQVDNLKRHIRSILISITIGAAVGVVSVVAIVMALGGDRLIALSISPKSVTTPIAIEISRSLGGIVPITVLVVVITGIFGSIAAPYILRRASIKEPIAKGLAIGAAAHAVGTAKAMEMGKTEGALSALAIGLMGIMTMVFANILFRLLEIL